MSALIASCRAYVIAATCPVERAAREARCRKVLARAVARRNGRT